MNKNSSCNYIIAEVGQNHQGSIDLALEYISKFSANGANAIKFQTRDMETLFDRASLQKEYNSNNAFAKTYGEHRLKLELDKGAYSELVEECGNNNVDFISTPFDLKSLDFLVSLGCQTIKIASFDCGNLRLLDAAASYGLNTILSVGGATLDHIEASVEVFTAKCDQLSLLHCVSQYPTPVEDLNLGNISKLKAHFPNLRIGISDHFNGILTGPLSKMLGADIFEKHVTFDRALKGTDHIFALEPDGFRRFCRDINRVETMIKQGEPLDLGNEPVFMKLGKSIVFSRSLDKGHTLSIGDLDGMILSDPGLPIREMYRYINQTLAVDVLQGDPLKKELIK